MDGMGHEPVLSIYVNVTATETETKMLHPNGPLKLHHKPVRSGFSTSLVNQPQSFSISSFNVSVAQYLRTS